jgi:hypothetical protein
MAKVIAPNRQYTGLSATVPFLNGEGETDNENLLRWFEEKGYEVQRDTVQSESEPELPPAGDQTDEVPPGEEAEASEQQDTQQEPEKPAAPRKGK